MTASGEERHCFSHFLQNSFFNGKCSRLCVWVHVRGFTFHGREHLSQQNSPKFNLLSLELIKSGVFYSEMCIFKASPFFLLEKICNQRKEVLSIQISLLFIGVGEFCHLLVELTLCPVFYQRVQFSI